MKDRINLLKGDGMKTIMILLVTLTAFVLTGCTEKEEMVQAPQEQQTSQQSVTPQNKFELHDAVRARDIDRVQEALSKGHGVNFKDEYGYNPLHVAVRLKEYAIAEYLIENGADVNNLDNYKDTPLLDSTRDNYTNLSKLLICNGATRKVADRYDMTPLHYTRKNENELISEMLISKDLRGDCQTGTLVEEPIQDVQENLPLAQTPEFKGLYEALMEEFKNDFEPWNAELTKDDLMFRFNDPVTLFERGSTDLKPGFTNILNDFFPRYLKVISNYKDNIQEVRVEGHTSSEYSSAKNDDDRYRLNKILSEKRANAVREFSVDSVLFEKGSNMLKEEVSKTITDTSVDGTWVGEIFQPYGMSYDNLIMNPDGTENQKASRRVDFRIEKK